MSSICFFFFLISTKSHAINKMSSSSKLIITFKSTSTHEYLILKSELFMNNFNYLCFITKLVLPRTLWIKYSFTINKRRTEKNANKFTIDKIFLSRIPYFLTHRHKRFPRIEFYNNIETRRYFLSNHVSFFTLLKQ